MSVHFSAPMYVIAHLVKGLLSDSRAILAKWSDDLQFAQRVLGNKVAKDGEAEECELQMLAEEFDDTIDEDEFNENEDSDENGAATGALASAADAINVQKEMERLEKEEKIINKHKKIQEKLLADGKIIEDNTKKRMTVKELEIQVLEQMEQTADEFNDKNSMAYDLSC